MSAERTRGLGRGLSALMGEGEMDEAPETGSTSMRAASTLPIEQVHPNPDQPRRTFDDADITSLAASIQQKGVLQPLLVRPSPSGSGYEIVAGERRWRAAQRAQLHDVPVIIRDLTDQETIEIAIIENVQRADLNPVDEARAYRQLVDKFGHSQDEIAKAVSKSRSHIANSMRLLALPDSVLTYLANGEISAGHARALINSKDAENIAETIVSKGLSVRATEAIVRQSGNAKAPETKSNPGRVQDADTRSLETDLADRLGLVVKIDHGRRGKPEAGEVKISYTSLEQLDDVCRRLSNTSN